MSIADIANATSVPYSATVKEFPWWGSVFKSKQLSFSMQPQPASNWCWAAAANSVSHFYWFRSTWTQCTIVNAELNRNDACNTPIPAGSNVPWYLDRALDRTNNFVSINGGQAAFAQIRAEIDAGRPVGARIGWNGGGGHFMMIYGYTTWFGREYVDIDDPIYGKSHLTLGDFSTNYQGSGTWTHYYITKSYRKWWWPDVVISEDLFKKIWQARQVMTLKGVADPEHLVESEDADEARFGLAHRIYALGLDTLVSKEAVDPEPVGLRVYETLRGSPVAFFDVDESGEGSVRAVSKSPAHLDAFTAAVAAAERLLPQDGDEQDENAETRLLRVPALNFEALWVLSGSGESLILPLLGVGALEPGQAYPFDAALELLREAAEPLADMDDTMGA
jgi:Papain-like cysteine protease AvrRpt2